MLRWLHSYLTSRKLTVTVEGFILNEFLATSVIPHSSHLGPLIFMLYFNDVNYVLKDPRLICADDLKIVGFAPCPMHEICIVRRLVAQFGFRCFKIMIAFNLLDNFP